MSVEQLRKYLEEVWRGEKNKKVRIAVFGQPGAGKSSLINNLLGDDVATVGIETDKTTEASSYLHNYIYITDLPGYGTVKFPAADYISKFDLLSYDAILCLFDGKLREDDVNLFRELCINGKQCLFVRTKSDALYDKNKSTKELQADILNNLAGQLGRGRHELEVYFISNRTCDGIAELESKIFYIIPSDRKDTFARGAKAYSEQMLEEKYKACEQIVTQCALLAACNGFNLVPGVNVAIDFGIMMKMCERINTLYGFDENKLNKMRAAVPIAQKILSMATEEGLQFAAKKFAGREVVKQFSKYVPIAGQTVAAGIGYAITSNIGKQYLDDCDALAKELLAKSVEDLRW